MKIKIGKIKIIGHDTAKHRGDDCDYVTLKTPLGTIEIIVRGDNFVSVSAEIDKYEYDIESSRVRDSSKEHKIVMSKE